MAFGRRQTLPIKIAHILVRKELIGQLFAIILRIQLQTDSRYQAFINAVEEKEVLGYRMKVASIEDVLRGKIWAYLDKERRKSKRQKDLADIFRIVEKYPQLEEKLPKKIREELLK